LDGGAVLCAGSHGKCRKKGHLYPFYATRVQFFSTTFSGF
jgi:hypothetical protein